MTGDSFYHQYSFVAETQRRWRAGMGGQAESSVLLVRISTPAFMPVTLALPSGSTVEPASAAMFIGASPPEIEFGGGRV